MQLKRVVVTGLGALTPIGNNKEEYWNALVNGVSGAAPITYFDAAKFKTRFACELKNFNATDFIHRKEARKMDRFTQYAMVASDEAIADSKLDLDKINKLKDPKSYGSWLKRIVINNSLQLVKKQIHFEDLTNLDIKEEATEENWYQDIPFNKIKQAILQLPNGCRQVFSLYLLENYKHKEIADLLNISVSTSKSQYRYALKLMRATLISYKNS